MRSTLGILLLLLSVTLWGQSTGQIVRFHTNLGDIDVALLSATAPKTVANFLSYVNRGDFNNSIIHRSVPGFIIQGGGFQLQNQNLVAIPQDPPVQNEYSVSNTRGTLAMAKLGSDPNSATNQWFFNEADNSGNLNNQNGGFTVFGRVVDAASLAVMDKIAAVPVPNPGPLASPFDQLPLLNYSGGTPANENFVVVLSVTTMAVSAPIILENGVVGATGFGEFATVAPGAYVEIYGSGLAGDTRVWAAADFTNGNAPTSLGGVSVSVNGRPAYVNFISPNQVNVQIPGNTSIGPAPVIVTYQGQSSAPVQLAVKPLAGGLFAPSSFAVNGKQYVAAIHASSGAFVTNGDVPGYPASPAAPGETLIFYGIGFGPVTPNTIAVAGQITRTISAITSSLQFSIGQLPASVSYSGLTVGLVGLYQFNVTVPADAPSGDLPLEVILGGQGTGQTLFLPVRSAPK